MRVASDFPRRGSLLSSTMQTRLTLQLFLCAAASFAGALTGQKGVAQPDPTGDAVFTASPAWQRFVQQAGGIWHADIHPATGTPRAIWGSGLPLADWRENSLAEARRHAGLLLGDQHELLGLGTSEFREVIGSRMGSTWVLVYDQFFRGLPVIGGRADVRVHMRGRIPMFGSTAWPIAAGFDIGPRLDADTATMAAWQALGASPTDAAQPARVPAPRLVIWGDLAAARPSPVFLAWEVAISNVDRNGVGPIGRWYVDARTGAVLHYENDKHECGLAGCDHPHHGARVGTAAAALPMPVPTTVTVRGWTRTGNDGFSALANVPLPGLVLNVPGIGTRTTDANGQFTIDIASAVTITVGALDGRHHAVMAGSSAPSGSFPVTPGVATTIQLLTSGATFNQAAHTTTTWWVDRTNEWCRTILGNSPELATADNVVPTVNIAQTCNAYYSANTINFYQAGGGCNNTAFSSVIVHEWGHGIDDRYGGISQTDGLSEGWGDILGLYLTDSPILGSGFQTAGVGIRDGNNSVQYGSGGGVHTQGQSWMGFAWKLRDRLATTLGSRNAAITLTETIVVGSIAADATDQPAAVREVFIADDDDGNLVNGTPHSVDLIWACNQHSLPYPGLPGPANDDCATAIPLVNGQNGPFTTVGALTSSPGWPCALGGRDLWYSYAVTGSGTLTVTTCGLATWDTALQIFSGTCSSLASVGCIDDSCGLQSSLAVPVTPGTYYIRVGGYNSAVGPFSLNVSGPGGGGGVPATVATYGTGCYRTSKAFYEFFATAGAFDLASTRMRLTRNVDFYVASAAGAYVAPTAAATSLALTDDSATTVTLAGAFPYAGGSTTTLEVCSNGFVSVAAGNGTSFTPTAAGWLAGTQPRWGCWHDYNPGAAGSGAVKFEQVGTVAYVTWDGVYDFGTTNRNTWQLQFDRATGNVTYAWQTMSGTGNAMLVGYAAAAPNNDLGSIDISAALPGTFRTSSQNQNGLALAGTAPRLGTTAVLTTTNYPAGSGAGVQAVSLTRVEPGIDLGSIGMPDCRRYTGLDVTVFLVPSAGQSIYNLTVPNDPSLQGLPVSAQTWALAPGANALGMTNSNGVAMVVGI
jgi:hypothetical protein